MFYVLIVVLLGCNASIFVLFLFMSWLQRLINLAMWFLSRDM